jgi:hypothetical protein
LYGTVVSYQKDLKLKASYKFLVYGDDNFLGECINNINRRTEALLVANKRVGGLEANTDEIK